MTLDEKQKQIQWLQNKMGKVSKAIPATEIAKFFNDLIEAYNESQRTKLEITKIESLKETAIHEITLRYQTYQDAFNTIFKHRRDAINKCFQIIDKGLQSGDKELIHMGMSNLSDIVKSSPFTNLKELSNFLEGQTTLEI